MILDRVPYGEKDWILTLLCEELGLVRAFARSARGSRHRFAGTLDLFQVVRVELRAARAGALASVISAEPVRFFPGILDRLERLEAGQILLAVGRDLLRDAPVTSRTYEHVASGFARLDIAAPDAAMIETVRTVLHLLRDIGHAPRLDACPFCGRSLKDGAWLTHDGHLGCGTCGSGPEGTPVPGPLLDALSSDGPEGPPLPARDLRTFLAALLAGVLGRAYRIADFLN